MNGLKQKLLKELEGEVAKENAEIKRLKDDISGEMFAKSTVTGGLFSNAARNACDKRANAARNKINIIEQRSAWKKEMLSKYK